MIRLADLVLVCLPSDALSQHHLTWVSLNLDVGYLFTAAPERAATTPYLDEVTPPDLERGVAPLGPPMPTQPPLIGHRVAPPSRCP